MGAVQATNSGQPGLPQLIETIFLCLRKMHAGTGRGRRGWFARFGKRFGDSSGERQDHGGRARIPLLSVPEGREMPALLDRYFPGAFPKLENRGEAGSSGGRLPKFVQCKDEPEARESLGAEPSLQASGHKVKVRLPWEGEVGAPGSGGGNEHVLCLLGGAVSRELSRGSG